MPTDRHIPEQDQKANHKTKTVCLTQVRGCPRGRMDLQHLMCYFQTNGWKVVPKLERADVVVLAGCAFTDEEEQITMSYVRHAAGVLARRQSEFPLVLVGCIAGIAEQRLNAIHMVLPLTRGRLSEMDPLISASTPLSSIADPNVFAEDLPSPRTCFGFRQQIAARLAYRRGLPLRFLRCVWRLRQFVARDLPTSSAQPEKPFHIRVGSGCMSYCSYCAIRVATGEMRSKSLQQIVYELESGLAQGHRAFQLIGEDVGAYGQDRGDTVVDLLAALFRVEGDFKIGWADFGPVWLIQYFPQLLELLDGNQSRIDRTGFPVQSGSDSVLAAMNRGYSSAQALKCLATLRARLPDIRLTTHMMVGFPGETRSDFLKTLNFVREIPFDEIDVYSFSPRSGTVASDMDCRISEWRKGMRKCRLLYECRRHRPRKQPASAGSRITKAGEKNKTIPQPNEHAVESGRVTE